MKKLTLLFLILCAGSAYAQRNSFSFEYSMGFGTGDLGDFNKKASFRGIALEWHKYLQPAVAVGFEVGWNVFYNPLPSDTYTSGTASLTGKQYRYQSQFPILATVNYYMVSGSKIKPFAGLGVGTMFSRRNLDMATYTFQQDAWHFAIRPEIGLLFEMNSETSAYLGFKYNLGLQAGDLAQDQTFLGINVGFIFIK